MKSAAAVLMQRYLKAREASGLRPQTRRLLRSHLAAFLVWLSGQGVTDLRRVTPEQASAYQRHLATVRHRRSKAEKAPSKPLAARTRYDMLAAVCRFFRWMVSERLLLADPTGRIELGARLRFQPRNVLTEDEVRALLAAPDTETRAGLRDRALLELLYSTGLRRAEIAALEVADIDFAGGTVFVSCGKGGRSRVVPLGERAAQALRRYVETARPHFVRKPGIAALFLVAERCGSTGNRLSADAIKHRIGTLAAKAGIERTVTPHALRHSLATHLLRAGASLRHVQAILGHARIDTTEAYTHLAVEDLATAHAKSHPRGRRRRA